MILEYHLLKELEPLHAYREEELNPDSYTIEQKTIGFLIEKIVLNGMMKFLHGLLSFHHIIIKNDYYYYYLVDIVIYY